MHNVALDTTVECTDGPCGTSTAVIINPVTKRLTHIVVEGKPPLETSQKMVSMDLVSSVEADGIALHCTQSDFEELPGFVSTHFVATPEPDLSGYAGSGYVAPYASALEGQPIPHNQENIPAGELAVHRGDRVDASDGHVGVVQEFLVDASGDSVTHIVVEEEHGLGRRLVSVPVSEVDAASTGVVILGLDRHAVRSLPGIPIKRHYARDHIRAGQLELVACIFEDVDSAQKALEFLEEQGEYEVNIEHAAVIVRDEQSDIQIRDAGDPRSGRSSLFGAVAGGLAGMLAGPLGMVVGVAAGAGVGHMAAAGIDLGLSDEFLENLDSHLEPSNSALVIVVDSGQVDELSGLVSGAKAIILQETLTDETIAQLKRTGREDSSSHSHKG